MFAKSMYTRSILLVSISLGVIAQAVDKTSKANSAYQLESYVTKLKLELQPDSVESSYSRAIVWDDLPTNENLENHYAKFDLLKVNEEQLKHGKFDIIEKNETIYERFFYAYYPDQRSTVTIFIKVNFSNKKNLLSMKHFVTNVNRAFVKYGFNENDVYDETDTDDSTTSILSKIIIYAVFIVIIHLVTNRIYSIILLVTNRIYSIILLVTNRIYSIILLVTNRIYSIIGSSSIALLFYTKELEIRERIDPENRPVLAELNNKIGIIYFKRHDHSNALLFYTKELQIRERIYPENGPVLAELNNKIGIIYFKRHDHSNALLFYTKELEIRERIYPTGLIRDIRAVRCKIDEYQQVMLSNQNKPVSLENRSHLAGLYNDIGEVYYKMENYQNAMLFFETAVEIERKSSTFSSSQLKKYEQNLEKSKKKHCNRQLAE